MEQCTGCTTGEVCGSKGYQPARNWSEATMTAALEAGTASIVELCTKGKCAPLYCDGYTVGHPLHTGPGPCPVCGGASGG